MTCSRRRHAVKQFQPPHVRICTLMKSFVTISYLFSDSIIVVNLFYNVQTIDELFDVIPYVITMVMVA